MEYNDYKKKYENSEEYIDVRNKNSFSYQHYLNVLRNWKIKFLYKVIPNGTNINTILEVGCATGDLLANFPCKVAFSNRTGLDISEKNIKEAKNRYPEINFFSQPFEEFVKHKKEKFDLIILSDILEHVPNDVEMLKIAGENSKYVILNLPLEKCWEFKDREYGPNDFRGHLQAYDIDDARKLVKNAGLEVINSQLEFYVKQSVFRRYLKNKLVANKLGINFFFGSLKYNWEIIEIFFRKNRYKKNYFAFLKLKQNANE
ncbi:MAG: class I SAM-dependent methyltransferase [Saprospiraceae bacterium]|nr:class I SAM-dependent methyltransferase [Saprospiraceae bacterium]